VGGIAFKGISMTVVTPPDAAARVPVENPSHSVLPGSLRWTWASTNPGISICGLLSSYGVPGGKDETSRINGRTDKMCPVMLEIVIVAGEMVRLFWSSGITARDETKMVIDSRDSRGGVGISR
jgi:hypothetical protein